MASHERTEGSIFDFNLRTGAVMLVFAAGVTLDASGNLYGTTSTGGVSNYGVVWEITP